MAKNEDKRIKLTEIICDDDSEITVGEAAETFLMMFSQYFELSENAKEIKRSVSFDTFVAFFTGFVNSYISTLYIAGSKDEEDFNKRMSLVDETNSDLKMKKAIVERRRKYDA